MTDDTINLWAEKLREASLPGLPPSLDALTALCAREDVSVGTLADPIEKDPALTLRLLCDINALRHKHLRAEVTTVEHALMMLGLERLRSLPATVPRCADLKNPDAQERQMRLAGRAYHAACQARDWVRLRKDAEPDEAYVAAQLHSLGEMLLWQEAPSEIQQIEELIHGDRMEPEEAQYVVLGFGIDDLSLKLAEQWRLPSLVRDSLHPENAQNNRVLGVMLAVQLARAAEYGWYTREVTAVLEQVADYLHLSFAETAARVHRTAVDAARDAGPYGLPTPAAFLLHPSSPEAEPGGEDAEDADSASPGDDGGAAFCLIPQRLVLEHALRELKSHMDGTLNLRQALTLAMEGMHEGIGLNRVVFAMLNAEKDCLKARAIRGSDNDPAFNLFTIELEGDDLFSRLLEKPQSMWLNDKNRDAFWPMVPQRFKGLTHMNSFFALSVFVTGKPVGIFYADRHTSACHLDTRSYHHFKQLGLQTAKTMGHLFRG